MPTTAKERTRTPKKKPDAWAGSAGSWKKRGGPHRITLPSGQRVLANVLGLSQLARLEGLPDDLTDAVVLHIVNLENGGLPAKIGAELSKAGHGDEEAAEKANQYIADFGRLAKHLVAEALVEPELTVDDLDEVPEEDLEMLMRIVTGRQTFDAAGVRIGVEPLNAWATFRDEHGCPPDCEACVKARRSLSSVLFDADEDL
jgi:hypothetical protein